MKVWVLLILTVLPFGFYGITQAAVSGDINDDGLVDLTEAVYALQVTVGSALEIVNVIVLGDINGDGKLDLIEAIYALQTTAGLAPKANPCVDSVDGIAQIDGNIAVLNENIDGTAATGGIVLWFTEQMDWSGLDFNSIVIWDAGVKREDPGDDVGYITDFSAEINGRSLTITTAEPIPEGDHVVIYLLSDDLRDLAGNALYIVDTPNSVCHALEYVELFTSNQGVQYGVLNIRIYAPEPFSINLMQECSAAVGDAGLPVLNGAYPEVFRTSEDNNLGLYYNLNTDPDYEPRLETLADRIGEFAGTGAADVVPGESRISFTPPEGGSWQISLPPGSGADPSLGPGGTGRVSVRLYDVTVGDDVYVEMFDDGGNFYATEQITLGDCVAPTTILNFAHNTCGVISNDGGIANNAAEICVVGEAAPIPPDIPGILGIPTLNITPRLLYDPGVLPPVEPITFYALYYDGFGTPGTELYDATEFNAWGPFPVQVDVAFSEDIRMKDGGNIIWVGAASITSWWVSNNSPVYSDGSPIEGGAGGTSDMTVLEFNDLLTLANVDHLQLIDLTNALEDLSGSSQADNARVVVNDLVPPFVIYAFWDGSLVIQFNETIDPDLSTDKVTLKDPSGVLPDAVISLQGGVIQMSGTRLIIPTGNLEQAGVTGGYFPSEWDTTEALAYDESIYRGITGMPGPYNHAILNWDEIPDANNGNTWADWKNGTYMNTAGTAMVESPEFALPSVIGPFAVYSLGITNFQLGDVTCPGSYSHEISYAFTHRLSLDRDLWPGFSCANQICTVSEINAQLDAAWVNTNVYTDNTVYTGPLSGDPNLNGLSATLAAGGLSMAITFTNDCYEWQLNDLIDPDWIIWSGFGIGTAKDLNANVVYQ